MDAVGFSQQRRSLLLFSFYFAGGATVSSRGNAVLKAQPDKAVVNVNIEQRDENVQVAKERVNEINSALIEKLTSLGLAEKVKLVGYNAYPEYDWDNGEREDKGYVVSQQISVTVEDFELIDEVLDASIDSGALVSYLSFELSEEHKNELKSEALRKASEDAREKARAIASGLGKDIGKLVSVKSQEFDFMPYVLEGEALDRAASDESDLVPQELDISATVEVEYKLTAF